MEGTELRECACLSNWRQQKCSRLAGVRQKPTSHCWWACELEQLSSGALWQDVSRAPANVRTQRIWQSHIQGLIPGKSSGVWAGAYAKMLFLVWHNPKWLTVVGKRHRVGRVAVVESVFLETVKCLHGKFSVYAQLEKKLGGNTLSAMI